MKRAINKLSIKPELILIDGNFAPKGIKKNFKTIINGDEKIKCISAASIIAKTHRDLLMIKLSEKFSNYAWERNFGYGTKAHLDGLKIWYNFSSSKRFQTYTQDIVELRNLKHKWTLFLAKMV